MTEVKKEGEVKRKIESEVPYIHSLARGIAVASSRHAAYATLGD